NDDRRSSTRIMMQAGQQVTVRATLKDGTEVSFFVENLSDGGGLLMCSGMFLHPGKRLDDCLLGFAAFVDGGVNLVVRWQVWARVGVQFDQLSQEATTKLSQFLAKAEAASGPHPGSICSASFGFLQEVVSL